MPPPDSATCACLRVERRLPSVLISDRRVWPKNDYIKTPSGVLEEAAEKHKIHETEADPAKIEGGTAAGAIPGCISTLSNTSNTAMMMKGE